MSKGTLMVNLRRRRVIEGYAQVVVEVVSNAVRHAVKLGIISAHAKKIQ